MIDEKENNHMTPCPITGQLISDMELENPNTKDSIPMCICTGRHMVRDDWCFCPISGMPALLSEYVDYIKEECGNVEGSETNESHKETSSNQRRDQVSISANDPVTGKQVNLEDLRQVSQVIIVLSTFSLMMSLQSIRPNF